MHFNTIIRALSIRQTQEKNTIMNIVINKNGKYTI